MTDTLTLSSVVVLDFITSFLSQEKTLVLLQARDARARELLGGHEPCGDSYLLFPRWKEGRAHGLVSAKCFEDEKAFSCVHCLVININM